MADIKQLDTGLLNHLNTEIIILDESLSILWVNDSALANGWINDTKNQSSYSKFFCPKTEQEIKRGKAQLKASLMMGRESAFRCCESAARQLLVFNRVIETSEILKKIENVNL